MRSSSCWNEHFATVDELRLALRAFEDRYNREWLIQRHGYRSPAAVRDAFPLPVAA